MDQNESATALPVADNDFFHFQIVFDLLKPSFAGEGFLMNPLRVNFFSIKNPPFCDY
jgi:hypothetical protein